jgi:hypothetical protein
VLKSTISRLLKPKVKLRIDKVQEATHSNLNRAMEITLLRTGMDTHNSNTNSTTTTITAISKDSLRTRLNPITMHHLLANHHPTKVITMLHPPLLLLHPNPTTV